LLGKAEALSILQRQLHRIDDFKTRPRFSLEFQKWKRDTEVAIENTFGRNTRHSADFGRIHYGLPAFTTSTPESAFDEAFRRGLEEARAVLQSLIDEVTEYWDEPAGRELGGVGVTAVSALQRVETVCRRFHVIARQLRARHANRGTLEVEDEYDVQDLIHALLRLDFDDIRDEEWTPSYAGAASRVDFLLKNEFVVVEVKRAKKGLADKELGEQLIIDIARYRAHPDCRTLVCFVYDPEGRIANPAGLEQDLNTLTDRIEVRVIVAPRGI
jgi:REase_DpnII-MboI